MAAESSETLGDLISQTRPAVTDPLDQAAEREERGRRTGLT
jgi:hypothetical protein